MCICFSICGSEMAFYANTFLDTVDIGVKHELTIYHALIKALQQTIDQTHRA